METTKGIIFNIQHFSIHDGPGIRTTVFLKGCPLRCPWCSNPESQQFRPEPMLDATTKKSITMGEERTTAFVEHEKFVDLIQYVDFIYTDLKHYNSVNHRKVTGVKNELIVQNIHYAFTHQKTIVLRIPVIPDFNDSLEDAERFATLFNELSINQVQLLPFHQFGENKYKLLGRKYAMEDVKALHPEDLFEYQDVFLKHDINCYF